MQHIKLQESLKCASQAETRSRIIVNLVLPIPNDTPAGSGHYPRDVWSFDIDRNKDWKVQMKPETEGKSAEEFWEERYEAQSGETSGKPTRSVETYVSGRAPGDALDLGCARGDDVVWLAKQGWQVLGVDIAEAALAHTAANAARNGVNNRIRLEQHDLAQSFPQGHFDLVTASFLQTPFEFPWENVIRQAAASIRAGGMLLTVTHQRVAPWSWQPPKQDLPGADELLARLDLDPDGWDRIFVGPVERIAKLPDGQSAEVTDAVIVLQRKSK